MGNGTDGTWVERTGGKVKSSYSSREGEVWNVYDKGDVLCTKREVKCQPKRGRKS